MRCVRREGSCQHGDGLLGLDDVERVMARAEHALHALLSLSVCTPSVR